MTDERRTEYYQRLNDLGDKVAKMEVLIETGTDWQKAMATQLKELVEAVHAQSLLINTLFTQRNTVIGVAAFLGSLVTLVGNWVFKMMTGKT